jgi:hypothetical protein
MAPAAMAPVRVPLTPDGAAVVPVPPPLLVLEEQADSVNSNPRPTTPVLLQRRPGSFLMTCSLRLGSWFSQQVTLSLSISVREQRFGGLS